MNASSTSIICWQWVVVLRRWVVCNFLFLCLYKTLKYVLSIIFQMRNTWKLISSCVNLRITSYVISLCTWVCTNCVIGCLNLHITLILISIKCKDRNTINKKVLFSTKAKITEWKQQSVMFSSFNTISSLANVKMNN